MRTTRRILAILLTILTIHAVRAAESQSPAISIRMQIYRIRGNISGESSLTDPVRGNDASQYATTHSQTVFTKGRMSMAGHEFTLTETEWKWDGKAFPIDGKQSGEMVKSLEPGVSLFSSPKLLVPAGMEATLSIGSDQPLEFFVRRPDGLYEHRLIHEKTGLHVTLTPSLDPDGRIFLRGLTFALVFVGSRLPLEGTSLQIGQPLIDRREITADLHVNAGRDYAILAQPGDGQGALLIRLQADLAPAKQ